MIYYIIHVTHWLFCLNPQSEEERIWFAKEMEESSKMKLQESKKVDLAKLLLKCQVCLNAELVLNIFLKIENRVIWK